MVCFSEWDEGIHLLPDQVKRRLNGEKIKPDAIAVDAAAQTATVVGSGAEPYDVTLSGCTCSDFYNRGLPCKHMYRLAQELGLLDPWPVMNFEGQIALYKTMADEIMRWMREYVNGNITPEKYVKIYDALMSRK